METSLSALLPSLGLVILQATPTMGQTLVASEVPSALLQEGAFLQERQVHAKNFISTREDDSVLWGMGAGSGM